MDACPSSGHTTAVASVAIATAILLTTAQRPRSIALWLVASLAAIVMPASVAIALIARHVHYATDTLAGRCVALATVPTLELALDFFAPRVRSGPSRNS